jgi:hypothetical protein
VAGAPAAAVTLEVTGQPGVDPLVAALDEVDGVLEVVASRRGESVEW